MCPEIKRIHAEPKYQSESGDYVLHSDHEAEIVSLRAELQNAAKAALDATALACEKEREADALRTEIDGLRLSLALAAMGDDE